MDASEQPHLLSVEDNPETRMLLKHLLGEDYQITFAAGFEEALSLIDSEGPFDCFLLDIGLGPGKSGAKLLHIFRDRKPTSGIPAIAVTAYAMPGDREDLLEKGFDGYVGKPFTGDELAGTIEQTLAAA
jgi:CheY-like chemotaxis protein